MPRDYPDNDYIAYLRRVRKLAREIQLDNLYELYRGVMKSSHLIEAGDLSRRFVPGHGSLLPRLVLIGEAPGQDEDRERKPFVGRAGALLDETLYRVGISRADDCFVTNVLKYRPPDNRNPTETEVSMSLHFVRHELKVLKPDIVVAMGRFANMMFFYNFSVPQLNGKLFIRNGWPVIPVWHPAAALYDRSGKTKKEFHAAFSNVADALARVRAGKPLVQRKRLEKVR